MQELVWLHQHHRDQRAVVEVHDRQNSALHQIVFVPNRVDIRHKILVLEVQLVKFLVVISVWIEVGLWRVWKLLFAAFCVF